MNIKGMVHFTCLMILCVYNIGNVAFGSSAQHRHRGMQGHFGMGPQHGARPQPGSFPVPPPSDFGAPYQGGWRPFGFHAGDPKLPHFILHKRGTRETPGTKTMGAPGPGGNHWGRGHGPRPGMMPPQSGSLTVQPPSDFGGPHPGGWRPFGSRPEHFDRSGSKGMPEKIEPKKHPEFGNFKRGPRYEKFGFEHKGPYPGGHEFSSNLTNEKSKSLMAEIQTTTYPEKYFGIKWNCFAVLKRIEKTGGYEWIFTDRFKNSLPLLMQMILENIEKPTKEWSLADYNWVNPEKLSEANKNYLVCLAAIRYGLLNSGKTVEAAAAEGYNRARELTGGVLDPERRSDAIKYLNMINASEIWSQYHMEKQRFD